MSGTRVLCADGKRKLCADGKRRKSCATTPCDEDCCECGGYYFHTDSVPTFDVRERVRNFNSAADCAAQTNCVTTTFNKYTDWAAVDPFECGHWKSTKISTFATDPCEAMPAAGDGRWGTPTTLDGGCEIRYNCDTNEWEFKIPAQGDVWYSLGAGTNDGASGTHDYGCIEILDPVYERHDVDVTVSGALCTPCPDCPDCAEAETSNEAIDSDPPETSWPADVAGCACGGLGALATGMSAWMTHRDTNPLTGPIPAPSCNEAITDWVTDERENVDYREYVLLSKVWDKTADPEECCFDFVVQWVIKHCWRVKVEGEWVYYCCERSSYQPFKLCYINNEEGKNVTVMPVGDVQGDVGFGAASVSFPLGPYDWPPLPTVFTGITATVTGLVGADVDIDFDLTVCPEGV